MTLPGESDIERPMRFAYADPPYPGQAWRCYGDHEDYAGEVDHGELILQLERDFPDGWALSTSSSVLPEILPLCPYVRGSDPKNPGRVEPDRSVRVLAWVKPNPPPRPVSVQYAWEAVILRGGRGGFRPVRDWLASPATRGAEVIGAKPRAFCRWLFACLGAQAGDELVDLFPGSGAVADEWDAFTRQGVLDVA